MNIKVHIFKLKKKLETQNKRRRSYHSISYVSRLVLHLFQIKFVRPVYTIQYTIPITKQRKVDFINTNLNHYECKR